MIPRPAAGLLPAGLLLVSLLAAAPAAASGALGQEAAWLQRYLRLDTSNPPGDEARAARFLAELLHREGLTTRRAVSPGGRTSLWARLESGRPEAGALLLQHHIDVVPPGPGWSTDPFAGEVRDGVLWGRGAIDAKSLGIAHLAALVELRRRRVPLARDVVFLAVADEETGGREGTAWLLEAHPELFAGVAAVLGEGGLNRSYQGRLAWWGIETAQKRPLWLRVIAAGRGGHGSTLNLHAAPHRLVRGLGRLVDRPLDYRVTPEVRRYMEAAAPHETAHFQRLVANLDEVVTGPEPERHLLPGMPNYFLDTIQVNVLAAGEKLNVVPEEAVAEIDVRLLPDTDQQAFLEEIRQLLGDEVEVEVLLDAPPVTASPLDNPIWRCLETTLGPRAAVVPAFIPGITDARYFRGRGLAAYGFSPFVLAAAELKGIHGPDERIPLAAFEQGVALMKTLVRACAGG